MRIEEIEEDLNIATGQVAHPAYLAAARIKWPRALMALKDMHEVVEQAMKTGVLHVEVLGAEVELQIAKARIAELESRIAYYGGIS